MLVCAGVSPPKNGFTDHANPDGNGPQHSQRLAHNTPRARGDAGTSVSWGALRRSGVQWMQTSEL